MKLLRSLCKKNNRMRSSKANRQIKTMATPSLGPEGSRAKTHTAITAVEIRNEVGAEDPEGAVQATVTTAVNVSTGKRARKAIGGTRLAAENQRKAMIRRK